MVAVKKDTRNHLSQRRLAQLGTVKNRSSDNGHMTSHFSLLHTPAGIEDNDNNDFSGAYSLSSFRLLLPCSLSREPYLGRETAP